MSSKILCLVPLWCHRIRLPQCFNAQLPIVFRDCQWHPSALGLLHLAQLWWWCHQPRCQQPSQRSHRIVLHRRNSRWRKHQQRWWWKLKKCVNPSARYSRCLCPLHHLLHQKLAGHRLAVSFLQPYLKLSEKTFVVRCENSGCQDANQKEEALFLPRQLHHCWKWSYCEDMVQWCSESFLFYVEKIRCNDVFFSHICAFLIIDCTPAAVFPSQITLIGSHVTWPILSPGSIGFFHHFHWSIRPFVAVLLHFECCDSRWATWCRNDTTECTSEVNGHCRSFQMLAQALLTEIWCFIIKQCSWF